MIAIDPLPHAVLVAALVVLWLHAGVGKLRDVAGFEGALAGYRLLPAALERPAARLLPAIELAIAAGLVASATRGVAAVASALLLSVYAVAIAINLARGRAAIDCGCGGVAQPIHRWLVGRDLLLAALSAAVLAPLAPRPLGALDALVAAMALACAIGLYATIDQWQHNRRSMRASMPIGEGGWNRR